MTQAVGKFLTFISSVRRIGHGRCSLLEIFDYGDQRDATSISAASAETEAETEAEAEAEARTVASGPRIPYC